MMKTLIRCLFVYIRELYTKGSDLMSDKNMYYCVGCAEIHPRRSFYKSYNHMHGNGTLPFCKDFIKDKVYDRKGENPSIEQFQNILMQLNMPDRKSVV